MKENVEFVAPQSKRRNNYVSYPADDVEFDAAVKIQVNGEASVLKTLQEKNLNLTVKTDDEVDTGKVIRQTRRTKKLSETIIEDPPLADANETAKIKKKATKNKKKKESFIEGTENESPTVITKKSKKRKGKKVSAKKNNLEVSLNYVNTSNGSIDSFHSAAGSPIKEDMVSNTVKQCESFVKSPRRASKRMKPEHYEEVENGLGVEDVKQSSKKRKLSSTDHSLDTKTRALRSKDPKKPLKQNDNTFDKSNGELEVLNTTFDKDSQRKRRSSIKNSTFDKINTPIKSSEKLNTTFQSSTSPKPTKISNTNGVDDKDKRMSLRASLTDKHIQIMNSTFEKSPESELKVLNGTFVKCNNPGLSVLNSTFEKSNYPKESPLNPNNEKASSRRSLNSTFDKIKESTLNSTFERSRRSRQSLNTTFEKAKESKQSTLNSTFEKVTELKQPSLNDTFDKSNNKEPSLNSTFDKETKLNSTYDKNEIKSASSKSSLISSDSTTNVTLDKSDNSRISITSDDSRTENIVNTTPLLIESSMDESRGPTPEKPETKGDQHPKPSVTPLKREGTFTKEGSDIILPPKPKLSTTGTPNKRITLPSPGSTPFPFSKSSQKEKSIMNVTRSIEKSLRLSSLAEPTQRLTKVMFCSPINNPAVLMQQKKKIIKSSLKGSNKSFVFDESGELNPLLNIITFFLYFIITHLHIH